MYCPHTATLIIATEGDNYEFDYQKTLLQGVFFEKSKGSSNGVRGMTDSDTATLYIPFAVTALQDENEAKYVSPKEYSLLEEKSGFWTLMSSGDSSAMACYVVEGDVEATSYKDATHDNEFVYRVSSVKTRDFGSSFGQHWQVELR